MLDIFSLVYTRVIKDARVSKYIRGSGTTYNGVPSTFPYLYFKNLGEPTTSNSLQNKQCAISADFEVTVYDSDSSSNAQQLIFIVAEVMRELGFTMNYGPVEIDRSILSEAYRWTARFHRTYCEGDLI